ncbi:MAG: TatD family hydrolase [Fibrobacteraceae bacterium]|nr:TatD family hydrolase [Fibrobacteraceae bacterium]
MTDFRLFDYHLHLARLPHAEKLAIELAKRGYYFNTIACEPWEWALTQEIFKKHSELGPQTRSYLSFGIHPMIAATTGKTEISELRQILEQHPFASVGECGLDRRYPGYEPGGAQENLFFKQASMALQLGRDLQIHCVGDYDRMVKILKDAGFGTTGTESCSHTRPIFHRFGGNKNTVKEGVKMGGLFSLHEHSFRRKSVVEAIGFIPDENIRFETDADESFKIDKNFGDLPLFSTELSITPEQTAAALEEKLKATHNLWLKSIVPKDPGNVVSIING